MGFRLLLAVVLSQTVLSCTIFGRAPNPTDAVVIDVYRRFGRGDCTSVRSKVESIDLSQTDAVRRSLFLILDAYCLELAGEAPSAREIYTAIVDDVPRSTLAYDAALRLRDLDRPDKKVFHANVLKRRQENASNTPPYTPAAKLIHRNAPVYPEVAAAARIEGRVLVDFGIAPNGDVVEPEVLASEPPFLFNGAALAAARHWIYEPSATSTERRAMVSIEFGLERLRKR